MGAIHVLESLPRRPGVEGSNLRLHVIYTTPEATREALKVAGQLARDLDVRLELLVPRVVPYPLTLEHPTISNEFTAKSLRTLVCECEVDLEARILLCRDREQAIPQWLPSDSIAIIPRRRQWGPGSARALIRAVRRDGHHVIVVNAGRSKSVTALLWTRRVTR